MVVIAGIVSLPYPYLTKNCCFFNLGFMVKWLLLSVYWLAGGGLRKDDINVAL